MTAPSSPPSRIVALDNLRVFAMLLGLVLHGAMPYSSTGWTRSPIRDSSRHIVADVCYFTVHDFRMQLFFLVAGYAAAALAARRGTGALVRNRLARVGLPLLLTAATVSPLMHMMVATHWTGGGRDWNPADHGGWVGPNFHLWFLYYLLLCCTPLVILLALEASIPARVIRAFDGGCRRVLASRWKLPVLAAAGVPVLWGTVDWCIGVPAGWVPDLMVFVYYLGFFLAGAVLHRHRDLLATLGRRWRSHLVVANLIVLPPMLILTLTGNRAEERFPDGLPVWLLRWKVAALFLGGLYTWMTILGLLGLFQRHFAASHGAWRYLAEASCRTGATSRGFRSRWRFRSGWPRTGFRSSPSSCSPTC